MEAFIVHERTYRLFVAGGKVVTGTAASTSRGNFRCNGEGSLDLGEASAPDGSEDLALQATSALRLELGGVDVIEGLNGSLVVAEVNRPCYFADQQSAPDKDLAGTMLYHLLEKSVRLRHKG